MRGEDIQQHDLFSYGSLEQRVPADYPLRPIRTMVDEALKSLDGRFEEIYDEEGRKSIPPERLLRALLLQMRYTVRSERMEQLEYNLLFRWFVGLSATGGRSGAAEAAAERRPLHRRWHANRSVGRAEEFSDEERCLRR